MLSYINKYIYYKTSKPESYVIGYSLGQRNDLLSCTVFKLFLLKVSKDIFCISSLIKTL